MQVGRMNAMHFALSCDVRSTFSVFLFSTSISRFAIPTLSLTRTPPTHHVDMVNAL